MNEFDEIWSEITKKQTITPEPIDKKELKIELLKQQTKFFTMLNEKLEKGEGIPVTVVDMAMVHYSGYLGREGYNFKKGHSEE